VIITRLVATTLTPESGAIPVARRGERPILKAERRSWYEHAGAQGVSFRAILCSKP
jgi:hypothetical protein